MPNNPSPEQTESPQKSGQGLNPAGKNAISGAELFADPVDFLKTLRSNYDKIAGNPSDGISLNDMIVYGHTAADKKSQAAAKIAATHFPELAALDGKREKGDRSDLISKEELDEDIQLVSGDIDGIIADRRSRHAWLFFGEGVLALAGAAVAIGSSESGVGFVAGGTVALTAGRLALSNYAQLPADGDVVSKQSKADQIVVNSWLHGVQ